MNTESARQRSALSRHFKRILLGHVCVIAVGAAMAAGSSPAAAKVMLKHRLLRKEAQHASKLPFGEIPQGPLEIFISINQQRLHFYSDGVHVADAPVATGVPGHLTPLGVFSVIQRDRYHHSNIYSNAPMPYMQRITWSGVALHEGPGVGHQASHGCIRMPGDFAARLWTLPTMGMRVIIAGPELQPIPFADPHLFVHRDASLSPAVALPQPVQTAQKVDPVLTTDVVDPPVDGSHAAPTNSQSAAAVTADKLVPHQFAQPPQAKEPTLAQIAKAAAVGATTRSELPEFASANAAGTRGAPSSSLTQPSLTPASPQSADLAPAAAAPTTAPGMTAPGTVDDIPIPLSKPARLDHGSGPIAIFISRKTGKIYVRQDFAPVFDAPVTIEHADQPIGTHVFTAMDYLPDHATLRWTVVSLPGTASKTVERWKYVRDYYGQIRRVRVQEREVEAAAPPETPQEALARVEIPQDVIAQISQLIVPGSSLIVSDQGLGPETGAGTDFIVVTR